MTKTAITIPNEVNSVTWHNCSTRTRTPYSVRTWKLRTYQVRTYTPAGVLVHTLNEGRHECHHANQTRGRRVPMHGA